DLELVSIFEHRQILPRDDGDDGEDRAFRLPAFGATAGVIVGDVALDADLDRLVLAFADQGPPGEITRAGFHATINGGVDVNSHGSILLVCDILDLIDDDRAY